MADPSNETIITDNESITITSHRLGKLPAKSSLKQLHFATLVPPVKAEVIPEVSEFWRKRVPFEARSYGNRENGCCVTGDAEIRAAGLENVFRLKYAGPVLEFYFSSGKRLTVTPNHPILTPIGFIPAYQVREVGYVLRCADPQGEILSTIDPHFDHRPATAEEIFKSLDHVGVPRELGSVPRPTDFHGDAGFADGEVDIVSTHSFLRDRNNTEAAQHFPQLVFDLASSSAVSLSGQSAIDQLILGPRLTTLGSMGGFGVRTPLFGGVALLAHERSIPSVSPVDASLYHPSSDGRGVNPEFASDMLRRFPGLVTVDRVLSCRESNFGGHVYDFSTPSRWYVSNGVISHNCTRASQANAIVRMERIEQRRTIVISTEEVLRRYYAMTERLYGGGDTGAYETDALDEWRREDLTLRDTKDRPYKIDAYVRVNHTRKVEIQRAIAFAGVHGIKVCFNLPAAWSDKNIPEVWDIPEGQPLVGDWMPGSWGGHSLFATAFNKVGPTIVHTWYDGKAEVKYGLQHVTWRAFLTYADEAYVVIDSLNEWKRKQQITKRQAEIIADAVNQVSEVKIAA